MSKTNGWGVRTLRRKARGKVVFLSNRIKMAEYALILRRIYGIEEKLGVRVMENDDGVRLLLDKETGFPFIAFKIDELPWVVDDPEKNRDIVRRLLIEDSPLKIVSVYYRQTEKMRTDLQKYLEDSLAFAKKNGVYTSEWEADLRGTIAEVEKDRVQYVRFGVVTPYTIQDELIDETLITNLERLIFLSLNGWWKRSKWENSQGQFGTYLPYGLERQAWSARLPDTLIDTKMGIHGIFDGNESFSAAMQIKGLGVAFDGELLTLLAEEYLHGLLPSLIESPGDTLVLVSSYIRPKPSVLGRRAQILAERALIFGRGKANLEDVDREEKPEPDLNYIRGFELGLQMCEKWSDPMVRVANQIIVSAPTKDGAKRLVEVLADRLHNNSISSVPQKGRRKQLMALKSTMPVVRYDDVQEWASPRPFRLIRMQPLVTRQPIEEGYLKILVGKQLPLGDPFYFTFDKNVALIAGQKSGKTTTQISILIKIMGMLPKDGICVWYDGTNIREEMSLASNYGLRAIANMANADMKKEGLNERLVDTNGVMYGKRYTKPEDVYNDFFTLVDAGVRLLVFSAINSVHKQHNTEFGFFDAYEELMRRRNPGVFFIDEILHLSNDLRAERIFVDIAPQTSKSNQMMIWTAQTSQTITDEPGRRYRSAALGNTPLVCVGRTPLIADLHKEVNINPELFREKARWLQESVADITLAGIPGIFYAVEAAGKYIQAFQVIIASDFTAQMIQRKSEEERKRYGV
jgi:hypothetical protein